MKIKQVDEKTPVNIVKKVQTKQDKRDILRERAINKPKENDNELATMSRTNPRKERKDG